MSIFVAGATGAVGLPLGRALCVQGHRVTGMTRPGPGVDRLRGLSAETSTADSFDAADVLEAIEAAEPDILMDQLTWLEGGSNLVAAAEALGVRRSIMQSRGFYLDAPAGQLADENAGLRGDAPGKIGDNARPFSAYESRVLGSPTPFGIVLRHGFFYGPGTWYRPDGVGAQQVRKRESAIISEGNAVWSFVHIDDAIAATVAPLTAEPGIYNVVDDDPLPAAEWLPAFARWVDAPEPPRLSNETARETAGAEAVYYHHSLTGASNGRAKKKLGFAPRPLQCKS